MGLVQNASASAYPVTVEQMRAHLRLTTATEDVVLQSYIAAATALAESDLNRSLITQTWKLYLDRFPGVWWRDGALMPVYTGDPYKETEIRLHKPPVVSVEKVYYTDTSGVEQTLAAANYLLDVTVPFARLVPAYNCAWPDTREQINAVRIEYTAGYGASGADVPADIVQAIKLIVSGMWSARAALSITDYKELPGAYAARALLQRHAVQRFD